MSYPIPVPKQVEEALTTATSEQLAAARGAVTAGVAAGDFEAREAAAIRGLIDYELQLRQVEPLSRKVTRFARRNKEGLGIAAAALGLAVGIDVAGD